MLRPEFGLNSEEEVYAGSKHNAHELQSGEKKTTTHKRVHFRLFLAAFSPCPVINIYLLKSVQSVM